MSEPKPFASLGPTLLARKGGARPAMRPQFAAQFDLNPSADADEDLGWNDMGEDAGADVLPLTPAPLPANQSAASVNDGAAEVHRQQQAIVARIEPQTVVRPVTATKTTRSRKSAFDDGRRAAFTLRLDPERHLKLRLACTIRNRSAQQLVTEALDRLLGEMADLESLAAQVKRN